MINKTIKNHNWNNIRCKNRLKMVITSNKGLGMIRKNKKRLKS